MTRPPRTSPLSKLILDADLTNPEAAALLGYSTASWRVLRNGGDTIPAAKLETLAKALAPRLHITYETALRKVRRAAKATLRPMASETPRERLQEALRLNAKDMRQLPKWLKQ